MQGNKFWVPGTPATFATKGEKTWKETLGQHISRPADGDSCGIKLEFLLPTLAPNNHPLDIDNLCEPVFSVLIGKKGWFGGKRTNLKWWNASKSSNENSGLSLSMEPASAPELTELYGAPFFDNVYEGVLPRKATDPQVSTWLNNIYLHGEENERYILNIQFGGDINIGEIATGKVKSLIDCLYPIIGGSLGKPEDWRIDILQVEKGVKSLGENAVRIRFWKKY